MNRARSIRTLPAVAGVLALAFAGALSTATAQAATTQSQTSQTAQSNVPSAQSGASAPAGPSRIEQPDRVLPPGWRTSTDRSVTTVGDDNGFNVLVADASSGYQWRTAASLSEPGFDTSEWIGQACVTGSGSYAAVVYAPRELTNLGNASDSGAFTAIVDLRTGGVRKLAVNATLAYYDPGCGTGDTVTFSDLRPTGRGEVTRLESVDAASGAVIERASVPGQLTAAVPYAGSIAAVAGNRLVSVNGSGAVRTLSAEAATPFRLHVDSAGGLAYEVPSGANAVQVRRWSGGKSALLGGGGLHAVQLAASAGRVFVLGPDAAKIGLGAAANAGWSRLDAPVDSEPSTSGALVVTGSAGHDPTQNGLSSASTTKSPDHRIDINALVTGTARKAAFSVTPRAMRPLDGTAPSPLIAPAPGSAGTRTSRSASSPDPATVTWDPDRACAISRNDPSIQTYQATAAQIEWAVDLAVQGQLTPQRGVNWEGSGMPVSWTPQGMFPRLAVAGGGTVPAQVLLGVLAQESNTLQASPHAVDAVTGNFNQGGFYGYASGTIAAGTSWSTADCGYGAGQVTTGMQITTSAGTSVANGSSAYTTVEQQQAIATDYASNIAASLNMLIATWNQLYAAGILANNGDPSRIENWYLAAWAYNTGVEPNSAHGNTTGCTPGPNCTDGSGNWGLGWLNNPANPRYPYDRGIFNNSATDTKVPNHWPYQELVMGWSASPVPRYNYAISNWQRAYAPGSWPAGSTPILPTFMTFCTVAGDGCTPNGAADVNGHAGVAGLCQAANGDCWWHQSVSWPDCATSCGAQVLTYNSGSAKPLGTDIYPPDGCTSSGLPSNAVIVDTTVSAGTCSGTRAWTAQGSMSWYFPASLIAGCTTQCILRQGKIDFHQLGVGFGGHIFFSHMINPPVDSGTSYLDDSMTATWTPPSSVAGWNRIKVHIPSSGATTRQADYRINLGNGQTRHRLVNQYLGQNSWVDLGSFNLSAGASVSLSNDNANASATDHGDVAFDAVAFVPTVKPLVNYVAIGDSFSSGESLSPYLYGSDTTYTNPAATDACHRSSQAYPYGVTWSGLSTPIQQVSANGGAANFAFLACSGAETVDLTAGAVNPSNTYNTDWGSSAANSSDYGELSQIDASGYLDPDTTLVTVTVGGNDARFADVMNGCILTGVDCTNPSYYLKRASTGVLDPQPLVNYEPAVITAEQTQLRAVYNAIHVQAPNAEIAVVGYPHLFPASANIDHTCPLATSTPLTATDVDWMNSMSDALDQSIINSISATQQSYPALKIKFIDTRPTFSGHEVCSTAPWINGIVGTGSSSSFNPMAVGHTAEAALFNTDLP